MQTTITYRIEIGKMNIFLDIGAIQLSPSRYSKLTEAQKDEILEQFKDTSCLKVFEIKEVYHIHETQII